MEQKLIKEEKKKIVARWGEKVTGEYELDDYGFPINPIKDPSADTADDELLMDK